MYDPGSDNSEFIEFLNMTNDSINVGGWQIIDENGNNFKLSTIPLLVPANAYFLLAADSLIISKYNLVESVSWLGKYRRINFTSRCTRKHY